MDRKSMCAIYLLSGLGSREDCYQAARQKPSKTDANGKMFPENVLTQRWVPGRLFRDRGRS
jgi:hypothetical protein